MILSLKRPVLVTGVNVSLGRADAEPAPPDPNRRKSVLGSAHALADARLGSNSSQPQIDVPRGISFPVGADAHDPGSTLPITMSRCQLRGTPAWSSSTGPGASASTRCR